METILDPSWRIVLGSLRGGRDNMGDDSLANSPTMTDWVAKQERSDEASSAPRPQDTASCWEKVEAPLPPSSPRSHFIHPKQIGPFPERLELPFPCDEILSGYEDIVSSGTDSFTTWTTIKPDALLALHMVDGQRVNAEFRDASERKHGSSCLANHIDKVVANRLLAQKRLSIYNWNPGPRRGKEDAFEKQIACKWHIITLQEASEYVDHDILTNRFHVSHYGGCAILFNKDTFHSDIVFKSIYLHDTRR